METKFSIENYVDYDNKYKIEVAIERKLDAADYALLMGAFKTVADLLDPFINAARVVAEEKEEARKARVGVNKDES